MVRVSGSRALLFVRGPVPLGEQRLLHRPDRRGEQAELAVVGGEEPLEHALDELVVAAGDRDGDAQLGADLLVLAEQDLEHDLVDDVVDAVDRGDLDRRRRLPVAVDAALALFEPGRVPRQVVVDDGVEELLEVDALGQTVRGDENPPAAPEVGDPGLALGGGKDAGDALDGYGRAERLARCSAT